MPTLDSGELTTIRTFPHSVLRYLSYAPRDIVFQCRVNGSPSVDSKTGGVYQFAYDTVVSGVYTDIIVGQTIDIGTTPGGNEIGTTRVRKAPTANTMYIAETAVAKLNIVDNAYVTVREEFRPWAKLPRLVAVKNKSSYTNSFTEYHDYDLAYSNENTQIRPKANITRSATSRAAPKPADWVDDGQVYRTVTLSSAFSLALANGASISSRLWNIGDCTLPSGALTDTTITIRVPVGFRYISLTVTDSNARTNTMYWPLWAHDEVYSPITEAGFRVTSDTRDEGREMGFEFFGQDDALTLPEGTPICYWEDATFGNDDAPPEQYIDSFLGWALSQGETLKLYDNSVYRITVGGIQTWLSRFTGYATKLSDKTPINRWFKMSNMTVDRVAHYVLREYTTALHLGNMYTTGITTTVKAEEVKKSDIWNQIVELQKGNQFAATIADSLNGIWFRPHYSYMELSDRAAIDIVMNLTGDDWTDQQGLVIETELTDKVSVVDAAGSFVSNSKNRAVYSKAPGLVPALTGGNEEAPFQRLAHSSSLTGQTRLNRYSGHHFARVNNPRNEVSLELIGNYDIIEQAWGEPITLTWQNPSLLDEGTTLNSAEFLVTRISVAHSNEPGTAPKTISWTLEEATLGEPGLTYIPPKSSISLSIGTIDFPKISLPTIQPFEWINIPPSVPTLAAVSIGTAQGFSLYRAPLYIAEDFGDNGAPTYVERSLPLASENIGAFCADPYSPYYVGTGTSVNGWALTDEGIWRISDLFADPTSSSSKQLTFPFNYNGFETTFIKASRLTQGWLIATHAADSVADPSIPDGVMNVWYTLDGGITWTNSLSIPDYSFSNLRTFDFIHMSEKVDGLCYIGIQQLLYRSTDYGATWELIDTSGVGSLADGHWVLVPKHDNPRDRILWFADDGIAYDVMSSPPNVNTIYRVNLDDISISGLRELPWPGTNTGPVFIINQIVQSSKNPGRMLAVVQLDTAFRIPSVSTKIYASKDAGATWRDIGAGGGARVFMRLSDANADYFTIFGEQESDPPFNVGYPDATKGFVTVSRDFGETFEDRSGNLISLNPIGTATRTARIIEVVGA